MAAKLTTDEAMTVEYYNKTDWKRPAGYWNATVTRFARLLTPAGRVIEIGCGEAYPADVLRALGFGYVGTDVSAHFVELATDRDPSLDVHHMPADDLKFGDDTFAGLLALNVLQHIEREHLPGVLAELRRVLRDGAVVYCTVAHHPQDDEGCDRRMWEKRSLGMESTRLFVFWQRPEIEALFAAYGFEVIDYEQLITNTAGVPGDDVHWHGFTLRLSK